MRTIGQILARLEALPGLEKALESRQEFDRFCLKAGLSPIDVAEILEEESGEGWNR